MQMKIGPINAATPTPLMSDGAFDASSAKKLCRRWIDVGLDGVLLLGSMGEGMLLDESIRTSFVETALADAGGQLSIFVSVADHTAEQMRERAIRYAGMGASCLVLAAPVGVSAAEAVKQVLDLCDTSTIPCAYYEVPAVTGVTLTFAQISEILSHPNIVAVKDSSNNPVLAQALTARRKLGHPVRILDGVEYRACYSAALGYDGVIHGGGVLTARRVRRIWNQALSGKIDEALTLDSQNSLCLARLYNRLSGPVQNIAGQKFALKLLGLLDHAYVMVDQPLGELDRQRIGQVLDENREWLA